MCACQQCVILAIKNDTLEEKVRQLESLLTSSDWQAPKEFRLTNMEAVILGTLLSSERAREIDFLVEVTRNVPGVKKGEPDSNIIGVKVSHIRSKLRPFGLEIENIFGVGYRLAPESRQRLLNWPTPSETRTAA